MDAKKSYGPETVMWQLEWKKSVGKVVKIINRSLYYVFAAKKYECCNSEVDKSF